MFHLIKSSVKVDVCRSAALLPVRRRLVKKVLFISCHFGALEDSGSGRAPLCFPWTRGCLTTVINLEHHLTRIQREMRCDDFIFPLNISAGIDHSVCPSVTA